MHKWLKKDSFLTCITKALCIPPKDPTPHPHTTAAANTIGKRPVVAT
jgi:hypothetical protein